MPSLFVILWNLFMSWSKLKIIFSLVKTIKICYLWLSLDASKIYSFKISNICNSFAICEITFIVCLKFRKVDFSWGKWNNMDTGESMLKSLSCVHPLKISMELFHIIFLHFKSNFLILWSWKMKQIHWCKNQLNEM